LPEAAVEAELVWFRLEAVVVELVWFRLEVVVAEQREAVQTRI
jgi:hypothetical protein